MIDSCSSTPFPPQIAHDIDCILLFFATVPPSSVWTHISLRDPFFLTFWRSPPCFFFLTRAVGCLSSCLPPLLRFKTAEGAPFFCLFFLCQNTATHFHMFFLSSAFHWFSSSSPTPLRPFLPFFPPLKVTFFHPGLFHFDACVALSELSREPTSTHSSAVSWETLPCHFFARFSYWGGYLVFL